MRDVFCDPGTESTTLTPVTQAALQNSRDEVEWAHFDLYAWNGK
jgi:hypothetical protein